MGTDSFENDFDLLDEFDPLAEEEATIEVDTFDEDLAELVDVPVMPNMPEGVLKTGIFDASNYDDPREAISNLFEKNPGRRPIFLQIIEMCEAGKPSSEIVTEVDALQAHNQSVYAPITLCRALERAGALTVVEPADEPIDEDAEFLEITEQADPIWTATEAGLDVLRHEREGGGVKNLLEIDAKYLTIYHRVLAFCKEAPRMKSEIDAIVDFDPLVQEPRRFSNHFIELLERHDALVWKDNMWNITELGKKTLDELTAQLDLEEAE